MLNRYRQGGPRVFWALVYFIESTRSGPKVEKGHIRPASARLATGTMGGVFGAAETLQKRLCHASDTPQKHSRSHPHLHLYVFSHRGEFHDQCARWSTPNARASAPSSFLRPLTPYSAPELGTCCLKKVILSIVFTILKKSYF